MTTYGKQRGRRGFLSSFFVFQDNAVTNQCEFAAVLLLAQADIVTRQLYNHAHFCLTILATISLIVIAC